MSQHEKHARQHHHTIEPVSDQVQQSSERLQFKHAMAHLDVHQQVQMMRPNAPIQMSGGHEGTRGIHKAAQEGIQGNSRSLPHLEAIQHSFGKHDVSGIQAFVGGAAQGANEKMGSEAYATGNSVAFKKSPDLHTAAHEAAHIVQQRSGTVQLKGGVGQVGDVYEQHADAVADAVVQGKSAEGILNTMAGPAGAVQHRMVQHEKDSDTVPLLGNSDNSSQEDELANMLQATAEELVVAYRAMKGLTEEVSKSKWGKVKDHLWNAAVKSVGTAASKVVPMSGAIIDLAASKAKGQDLEDAKAEATIGGRVKKVVSDMAKHPWRQIPGGSIVEELGKAARRAFQSDEQKAKKDLGRVQDLQKYTNTLNDAIANLPADSLDQVVKIAGKKIPLIKHSRTLADVIAKYNERQAALYEAVKGALERTSKEVQPLLLELPEDEKEG
ncbi:MAG: DUF4157 domain-containing protein [Myxococcota bacterium]